MEYTPIMFALDSIDNSKQNYDNFRTLQAFLNSANTSDKQEYLQWVSAWKLQAKLLEAHIRHLKSLRKERRGNVPFLSGYRSIANDFYEARLENKKLSWANKQALKELAEVA